MHIVHVLLILNNRRSLLHIENEKKKIQEAFAWTFNRHSAQALTNAPAWFFFLESIELLHSCFISYFLIYIAGTDHAPEEHRIPRATVARIMRHGSPPNSTITGDAKEAVANCLVEFCAVLIAAAVEECRQDKRTTVTGDDLILALANLGFEDYVRPLALYLRRYREIEGNRPRARHSSIAGANPAAGAAAVGAWRHGAGPARRRVRCVACCCSGRRRNLGASWYWWWWRGVNCELPWRWQIWLELLLNHGDDWE